MKKIGELANKYESLLTKAEKLYLTIISFSTSNFYELPKVHKSIQVNEAIQHQNNRCIETHEPEDLTVRSIVSRPNCSRSPLSDLIDIV